MNNRNLLPATLDHTFGFEDQKKSAFRKVSQTFDDRTNEHIIMIEYRVHRGGDGVATKNSKNRQIRKLKLLSQLMAKAQAQGT